MKLKIDPVQKVYKRANNHNKKRHLIRCVAVARRSSRRNYRRRTSRRIRQGTSKRQTNRSENEYK